MFILSEVSKRFGEKTVLSDVSIRFELNKTHVLLGASGCGKSTLLRMMQGLLPYESGTIEMDGKRIDPSTQLQLAPRTGYMIQDGGLFPHLSARANVTLPAEMHGWSSKQIAERIDHLGQLVGLPAKLLERFPKSLSGGQKQRVALMRALMMDPPYLFMDEPLGALDPIIRNELQTELKTIFNGLKKTVFMVTHDLSEAAYFGHTVTLFRDGRVLQHSPFEELVHTPKDPYVTDFINAQRPLPMMMELA